MRNNQQGTVTLEAALTAPLIIILVMSLWMVLVGAEAEVVWRAAGQKSCEEFSLLLAGTPAQLVEYSEKIPTEADLPLDLTLTQLTGGVLLERVQYWFYENTRQRPWLRRYIRRPQVYLDRQAERAHIHVQYTFAVPTCFGDLLRRQEGSISLWSPGEQYGGGAANKPAARPTDDSIWSAGNFVRGLYFREKAGGNLPNSYPVISSFQNGTAVSTKSIDLTSPRYRRPDVLDSKVQSLILDLSSFSGTAEPWGKQRIYIRESDIRHRKLILVVPTNSSSSALQRIDVLKTEARRLGVELEMRQIGHSSRYEVRPSD